ncbi:hypothetical protein EV702DRAFT_1042433 [Suillus placidus]|uniref:Uncharacterized protein n=1 Tax=Suillus placidus TaxID=48579 RepID=A0A9P7A3Y0_9AGAM|nr:hypothetical protein EV702DRAFT_1042433 [Suillus placidus]
MKTNSPGNHKKHLENHHWSLFMIRSSGDSESRELPICKGYVVKVNYKHNVMSGYTKMHGKVDISLDIDIPFNTLQYIICLIMVQDIVYQEKDVLVEMMKPICLSQLHHYAVGGCHPSMVIILYLILLLTYDGLEIGNILYVHVPKD